MTPEMRRALGNSRGEVAHLILHHLRVQGYSAKRVAADLGVTGATITKVMRGHLHSPRVLDALREMGVPEKWLFDPRRVEVKTVIKKEKVA